MQLNLCLAPTLRGATKGVIKNISISNDIDLQNFLIVPDRFSLQAEKLLFSQLNITSTFNIEVISISKLASLVLKLAGQEFNLQNNIEGFLIIYKLLIENQNNLESLKNANITLEFAKEIFLTISQLKSCEIDYASFAENAKKINSSKFLDIAEIYGLYEKEIKNKMDATELLNLFKSEIANSDLIKKSNFYFAEFDSFTAQGKSILKLLIQYANSVTIGAANANLKENEFIYEDDVLKKVSVICSELKIIPNIISVNNLNDFQQHINQNLFAFKQNKKECNNAVAIINNASILKEITQIANIIKYEISQNGFQFNDFNIFVPNLESYQKQIEEIFLNEDISYYIDNSSTLYQLTPVKYIFNLINYLKEPTIENFLIVINDDFSQINKEDIFEINKQIYEKGKDIQFILNNFNSECFNQIASKIKLISEKYNQIENFNDFVDLVENIKIQFNLSEQVILLVDFFELNSDLNNEKLYAQFDNKFSTAIEQAKKLNISCKLDIIEMENICKEIFSTTIISNLPLSINSVFVGQNDISYFEERQIGIFCGCNSHDVPSSIKDCGIILDDDILKFDLKIEPSVQMINKRNKFKLFNDACLSTKKVYISRINDENIVSDFVASFKNMWLLNNKALPISDDFYISSIDDEELKNKNLIYKSLLNSEYRGIKKLLSNRKETKLLTSENIININQILYPNNSTSISKIQQFFNCPFLHFANYGLLLKENEIAEIKPQDIGNLFHDFAQYFLKLQNTDFDIQILFKCFNTALNSNERLKLLSSLQQNKVYFEYLKHQAYNFAKILLKQIQASGYKPYQFEKEFTINLGEIGNEKFLLNGRIDRIDKSENSVIIMDYKTGKAQIEFSKFYEGRQLQLPIYIVALSDKQKVEGAFYFPIVIGDKIKSKKLCGYFENNTNIIKKIDKSLSPNNLKSEIINLTLKKNSTEESFKVYSRAGILEDGNLLKLGEYAKKIVKSGIQESLSGNVKALPVDTQFCKTCPYYKLCCFNIETGIFRESSTNVKEDDIIKILEEE